MASIQEQPKSVGRPVRLIGDQDQARVAMRNDSPGDQKRKEVHVYPGGGKGSTYPANIPPNHTITFNTDGNKQGVVYKGTNKDGGSDNVAWLMAYHVPSDGQTNKVYVECGNINAYNNVDWDDIENKLDAAGSQSTYEDSPTHTKASAQIDSTGGNPKLNVTFSVTNST